MGGGIYRPAPTPMPVDPGVYGLPGGPTPPSTGLPVPIPSTTDQTPQLGGNTYPGSFQLAAGVHGNMLQPVNPIEHVIAQLGIHPQSGLASAFRAIHAALTAHLAAQVQHAADRGMQHPHAQVGHGLSEPVAISYTPQAHPGPAVHQRPGPVLQ